MTATEDTTNPHNDPEPCHFVVKQGNYFDPPEFCEEDAEEGSDFCAQHAEYDNYDEED